MIAVTAAPTHPDDVDVVGIPVTSDLTVPGGAAIDVDELRERGFEGRVGETQVIEGVVAVGMGDEDEITPDVVRRASAALVKASLKRTRIANRLLDAVADDARAGAAQAAAEGSVLGAYRFDRYRSEAKESSLESVVVVGKGGRRIAAAVERGAAVGAAVTLARDLVNTPSGDLTPPVLADIAVSVAGTAGLVVDVVDEKAARKQGLGGITGVGQGSENPPRLVRLVYDPPGARTTLALVGKGITFDSGGLSIKPAEGMMTMKTDMSGAAAVLATMSALPALAPRTKVIAYLCLAENMPSGRAIRPGDVLRIKNGKTVEVLNTDAEGRLVLADGLSLAVDDGVDAIVDIATLTGACMVALGNRFAGLMGNHDGFVEQVQTAAERGGELVWPLPLPKEYRKQLDSEIADLKNVSAGRYGGALTAGLFLQEFVADVPWAHLDIAGPARAEEDEPLTPRGGSGFGVRTLIELVSTFKKPSRR